MFFSYGAPTQLDAFCCPLILVKIKWIIIIIIIIIIISSSSSSKIIIIIVLITAIHFVILIHDIMQAERTQDDRIQNAYLLRVCLTFWHRNLTFKF
jgi:hypothetical protein